MPKDANDWLTVEDIYEEIRTTGADGYDTVMDTFQAAACLPARQGVFSEAGGFGEVYTGFADEAGRPAIVGRICSGEYDET